MELQLCIPNEFLSDAEAADPGSTLEEPLLSQIPIDQCTPGSLCELRFLLQAPVWSLKGAKRAGYPNCLQNKSPLCEFLGSATIISVPKTQPISPLFNVSHYQLIKGKVIRFKMLSTLWISSPLIAAFYFSTKLMPSLTLHFCRVLALSWHHLTLPVAGIASLLEYVAYIHSCIHSFHIHLLKALHITNMTRILHSWAYTVMREI